MPDFQPAASRVGRRIGVYQIVEELVHGGMGEVYRAARADGQYDKQVAIKFVRGGFDYVLRLERFPPRATNFKPRWTILILARLHDGGTTEDGVPYWSWSSSRATPIDQYCEKHQLSIGERLVLFNQIFARPCSTRTSDW